MKKKLSFLIPLLLIGIYFAAHLWRLTAFPVFADEAIYIRWAQLVIDDWRQYLFFALNDGKTPLFIWSMIPFQLLFRDQLFAARFVSVLVGVVQLFALAALTQAFGGRKKTQWLAMALMIALPYWYFHHHLALMDGMLGLFLSITVLGLMKLSQVKLVGEKKKSSLFAMLIIHPLQHLSQRAVFSWVVLTGVSFGLALWTKLPALFILPVGAVFSLLPAQKTWQQRYTLMTSMAAAAFLGLVLFLTLKMSPAFGQLFSRGQDFTYPISEILFEGKIWTTLANIPRYLQYFGTYLTWPLSVLAIAGLFSNATRRQNSVLLLTAAIFCAPFVLLGKVIYARYLFPAVPFITVASVLSLQALYDRYFVRSAKLWLRAIIGLILATVASSVVTQSLVFIAAVNLNPDLTPLVASDRVQYLEEWSSGHGIYQTAQFIKDEAKSHTIAVATEGRFGTLPDGLLLYFHRTDVRNIYIEGIHQYPVKSLPDFFTDRAKNFDRIFLVVNSHRLEMKLPAEQLVKEYCRPNQAPCLQVWDVTPQVKK